MATFPLISVRQRRTTNGRARSARRVVGAGTLAAISTRPAGTPVLAVANGIVRVKACISSTTAYSPLRLQHPVRRCPLWRDPACEWRHQNQHPGEGRAGDRLRRQDEHRRPVDAALRDVLAADTMAA